MIVQIKKAALIMIIGIQALQACKFNETSSSVSKEEDEARARSLAIVTSEEELALSKLYRKDVALVVASAEDIAEVKSLLDPLRGLNLLTHMTHTKVVFNHTEKDVVAEEGQIVIKTKEMKESDELFEHIVNLEMQAPKVVKPTLSSTEDLEIKKLKYELFSKHNVHVDLVNINNGAEALKLFTGLLSKHFATSGKSRDLIAKHILISGEESLASALLGVDKKILLLASADLEAEAFENVFRDLMTKPRYAAVPVNNSRPPVSFE
ncbi:MAG: hypothetical protein KBD78_11065 [Oligoflexales bacterium]|nr:hypothetical protein [Oligoflexales bacterium]